MVCPPGMFCCSLPSHRAVKPEGKKGSVRLCGGMLKSKTLCTAGVQKHMEVASCWEDFRPIFQVGKSFTLLKMSVFPVGAFLDCAKNGVGENSE